MPATSPKKSKLPKIRTDSTSHSPSPSGSPTKAPSVLSKEELTQWKLPSQGNGPYRSSTFAIRENIRKKMETIRNDVTKRGEFDDYCFHINKDRQGERIKNSNALFENAREAIKNASLQVRKEKCKTQAAVVERKGEEARMRKFEGELNWYSELNRKCEDQEEKHQNHQIVRRQVCLLEAIVIANSVQAFRNLHIEIKKRGKKGKRISKLGGVLESFDNGLAQAEEEQPPFNRKSAFLMIRASAIFIRILIRIRRARSTDTCVSFLKAVVQCSAATRALRRFFFRVKNAQRMSRSLVAVCRARAELVNMLWDREELRQKHKVGNENFPSTLSKNENTSNTTRRKQSIKTQPSPQSSGLLLPPVQRERRLSGAANGYAVANPEVWRPKMAKELEVLKKTESMAQMQKVQENEKQQQEAYQKYNRLKSLLDEGVPLAIKMSYIGKHLQHMRRVNLHAMHEYLTARDKFRREHARLSNLIKRGFSTCPISGKNPEEEILYLRKPIAPVMQILPPKEVVEAHVASALNDVLRREGIHLVTKKHKQSLKEFEADVKLFKERKAQRTKMVDKRARKSISRGADEDEDLPVEGMFEFSFGKR